MTITAQHTPKSQRASRRAKAERNKLLDTMTARILAIRAEIGETWPTGADLAIGAWATTNKLSWTAGYWIEMLRIAGERTGDWDLYEDAAARMMRLRLLLAQHSFFNAPAFYYGAARLYETLSDRASRTAALSAAYSVRATANPARGAIFLDTPAGKISPRFHVPIEAAYHGLLLDWWALQETGDTTFLDGAERMLDLLIKDFIADREYIPGALSYDRLSGMLLGERRRRPGTRLTAPAHALCGLLRGWEVTRETRFLSAANRVLEHWNDQWVSDSSESLPTAMVCEALARLAVLDPQPKKARHFIDQLDVTLDVLAQRLMSAFAGNANTSVPGAAGQAPIDALYHLYAALHCLEAGGLPC